MAIRKYLRSSLKFVLGVGLLTVALGAFMGEAQGWPYCISGCDAKDVKIDGLYLENPAYMNGVLSADVYVDFSVTAANRYCVLIAIGFSTASGCPNVQSVWKMFGDLPQGTYTHQYVGRISVVGMQLWVCRQFAEWRNQDSEDCPTGDCNLYAVGSKCWESTGGPYIIYEADDPKLSLAKKTNGVDADTPTGPVVSVGSTVTWTYEVTNTGNVTLTNIVVTDDELGTIGTISSLAPGASQTLTKTGTAVAGQYGNVGTAQTTYNGQTVTASDPSHYFGAQPGLALEKKTNGVDADTPTGPVVLVGSTVTWTYEVTNTGNVTLTNVVVTDDELGTIGAISSLAPGASQTLTKTGTAVAGQYGNIGTATTTYYGQPVSATDPSYYFGAAPAIQVVKTGTLNLGANGRADAGDTISYTFAVTNTGNVTLTNVTVTDPKVAVSGGPLGSLAPGVTDATTFTGTYILTQADIDVGTFTNVATARGYHNGTPVMDTDGDIQTLGAQPALMVVKSANPKTYSAVGQQITYTFTVTNMGNVTLTSVKIDDARLGINELAVSPSTLGPGQQGIAQALYTITQGDLDIGSVANVATATATPPAGPNITATDSEIITALQLPALTLEKRTNGADADTLTGPVVSVGSTVTWTYEVTNTGNVTLTNIVVTDDKLGTIGAIPSLGPEATITLTRTGVAVVGQYANTGTAQTVYNGQPVTASDPSHYVGVDGYITVTPGSATNEVGDPHTFGITAHAQGTAPISWALAYTITPTPGNASLSGPTVAVDGMSATWNLTINHLSPATFTASATVTMTFPGGLQVVRTTNGAGGSSGPATKIYEFRQAKIELTPGSDTNEVGEDHVITATVRVWNGTSWVVPPSGGSVTFSLVSDTTGTAAIVSTNPASLMGGQAPVTIRATKPGLVKVHAVADVLGTGTVTAETGVGSSGPDAEKAYEYRQARIRLSPLADTNGVGESHTFTTTVEVYVVGTGWVDAPDGTPVTFSFVSNPIGATFVGASSTTTAGGQAQATIIASQPGTVTVKAQATVGTLTVETNGSGENSTPAGKAYVTGSITITPGSATNEVGDPHTFGITAHAQGTAPISWALAYTITPTPGNASLSGPTVAVDGMSATWNLTINHLSPATFTASATVTMTFPGGLQVVRTTNGAGGSSGPATKTYLNARISLSPLSATNEVGDPHTFVAAVETTSNGSVWSPAAGTKVTFFLLSGTGSFVGGVNTAFTNAAGQAAIQIVSSVPGALVLQAAADVFGDGTFIRTTGTLGNGPNAEKAYADARIHLTPTDSVNPVGTNHTVTAFVEVNTGAGWVPAPDGTPVLFTLQNNTAGATFVTSPTLTTSAGQAAATVFASNPGAVIIKAAVNITINGATLRRETGSGGPNGPDALKNWISTNEPLTAETLSLVTCRNTPLTFALRGSDPDVNPTKPEAHSLAFSIIGAPTHGALSGNLSAVSYSAPHEAAVGVVYTPEPDFLGMDYLTYTITDPTGTFALGRVQISVVDCGEEVVGGAGALGAQIVINEVAWGGTAANANHEWIELYSGSQEPVDLTGWTIRWRQKQPTTVLERYLKIVELRGILEPYGFYLLERHTDDVISNIKADLIYAETGPVVITEVAWGGTPASSEDQWIELTNVTENPVDLEGWILRWHSARPAGPAEEAWKAVELRGTIPPFGTYLLERGDDEVVADVPAGLVFTAALDPRGEVLELLDSEGRLVDTANVERLGRGGWAAGYGLGGAAPWATLERVSPFAHDREQDWKANTGLFTHGLDRAGNPLTGTPGAVNEQFLLWGYSEVNPAELPPFLAYLPFNMDLSDRGAVVELVDPLGNVISTANADRPDRDGWAAGYLVHGALAFATMERLDPSLPDLDQYWDANEHIVIHGLDADDVCLTATARVANERLTMRYQTAQFVQSVPQGQILTVALGGMPDLEAPGCIVHVALMAVETPASGAGATHALLPKAWALERLGLTDNYRIYIATAELSPGLYYLWIATGDGRYRLIAFSVTEAR